MNKYEQYLARTTKRSLLPKYVGSVVLLRDGQRYWVCEYTDDGKMSGHSDFGSRDPVREAQYRGWHWNSNGEYYGGTIRSPEYDIIEIIG